MELRRHVASMAWDARNLIPHGPRRVAHDLVIFEIALPVVDRLLAFGLGVLALPLVEEALHLVLVVKRPPAGVMNR
jgi:hypothetical protein